jgi:prophage antirepressor-like protein
MNNLVPFEFETNNVRVIMDENNEPWFVAIDVAKILGYALATDLQRMLDDDEADMYELHIRSKTGVKQKRKMLVINESGLYHAVVKSRKPTAKRFRKWVTLEVLPSIRKTGQYQIQPRRSLTVGEMLKAQAEAFILLEHELKAVELNSLKRDRKLARDQAELDRKFQAIETAQEYFTILGWWNLTFGEPLTNEEAASYGRTASRYCRKHNYKIGRTTDPRFGAVNTYPREVLELLFLD